jgi:Adenylate cyclase, class 2 (thermophilic)
MFEIEMKAHATDRSHVADILNSIAQYDGMAEKKDTYYHLPRSTGAGSPAYLSCRVRHEVFKKGTEKEERVIFTYKRKELRSGTDGAQIEVNDEKECTLSGSEALEAMFSDAGFTAACTKYKIAEGWFAQTEAGTAHIELCTVPPLGDFLEIEIMSEVQDESHVAEARKCIESLFSRCGIPLSAVENRYYNEMLAAAEA